MGEQGAEGGAEEGKERGIEATGTDKREQRGRDKIEAEGER